MNKYWSEISNKLIPMSGHIKLDWVKWSLLQVPLNTVKLNLFGSIGSSETK